MVTRTRGAGRIRRGGAAVFVRGNSDGDGLDVQVGGKRGGGRGCGGGEEFSSWRQQELAAAAAEVRRAVPCHGRARLRRIGNSKAGSGEEEGGRGESQKEGGEFAAGMSVCRRQRWDAAVAGGGGTARQVGFCVTQRPRPGSIQAHKTTLPNHLRDAPGQARLRLKVESNNQRLQRVPVPVLSPVLCILW